MDRLARSFNRFVDVVLVASLAVITGILVVQVGLRYLFNSALPWPEELSQFLLVLISFLGMYRAIGKDQHIRIDWLPKTGRHSTIRALRIFGLLSVGVFLAYVGYGGWLLALSAWDQPSTALRLPMFVPYLIVPVTCVLSLLAIGAVVRKLIWPSGDQPESGR